MDKLLLVVILFLLIVVLYGNSLKSFCKGGLEKLEGIKLRRWSDPPQNNLPGEQRSVQDDWWAQQYNSGQGLRLG